MPKRKPQPSPKPSADPLEALDGGRVVRLLLAANRAARRMRAALREHVCETENRAGYCDDCYLLAAIRDAIRGSYTLGTNVDALLVPGRHRPRTENEEKESGQWNARQDRLFRS